MDDTVVMERVGPVAVLRLNRPAKLNAISYAMADRLLALLDRVEADAGLHAVIITGAGDRAVWRAAISPSFGPAFCRVRIRRCATLSGAASG